MISQRTQYFLSLLIFASFFSCKNLPEQEKSMEEQMIGKWKLTNSTTQSDSIFIGSSWIEFSHGNLFKSNSSFFWTNDSSRLQSRSGKYSVSIWSDYFHLGRDGVHGGTDIVLQVDTISKSWSLELDSLTMHWSSQYTWTK